MFGSLGVIFEEKSAFKTANFMGTKFANEFLCKISRFKIRVAQKVSNTVHLIGLKFLGTVNRAVLFQTSELMFLQLDQKLYH